MSSNNEAVPAIVMGILIVFYVLIIAVIVAVTVLVWWKICKKAGFSGWLGLLMIVPIANLVLPLVIAFMDWPVLKELRALKQGSGNLPPQI
jgi:hypothetical protein